MNTNTTRDSLPTPTLGKSIAFVSGSWYDIGKQFAQQAPESVQVKLAEGTASAIRRFGSKAAAMARMHLHLRVVESVAPEFKRMWEGIADGTGNQREDVFLAYTDFNDATQRCSNLSAWGNATRAGEMLCGMNCDESEYVNYYTPSVILYPENGYTFLSASGLVCNCVMNEKGLVIMASCGENARPEDQSIHLPNCSALLLCAANCTGAEEACNKILSENLGPGSGENMHIADAKGLACVIEHTASGNAVRRSGDFGEHDYLVAANHFLTKEMQPASLSGAENFFRINSYFRYWSEEAYLREHWGNVTLETLREALGNRQFYLPKDTPFAQKGWLLPEGLCLGWNETWNGASLELAEATGKWSPEVRTPIFKCAFTALAHPAQKIIQIMNGCRDIVLSQNPWATGRYDTLQLCKSPLETTEWLLSRARTALFEISRGTKQIDMDRLNSAKLSCADGLHLMNRAICEEAVEKRNLLLAKAATCFLHVNQYASAAAPESYQSIT